MSRIGSFLLLFLMSFALQADDIHNTWDDILQQYVVEVRAGATTEFDYQGLLNNRQDLEHYLDNLGAVTQPEFNQWSKNQQLAFLINVYNAYTVDLILDNYGEIQSIRDIGSFFNSPWKKDIVDLFGDKVSLDYVEHELIRSRYQFNEPRIHFAVNCASIGCPSLRAEAYRGDQLEQQLEEQTQLFLADTQRNRRAETGVQISKIFDWYEEDFERGWLDVNSVVEFLVRYADSLKLTDDEQQQLLSDDGRISYLNYDWKLNGISK